MVAWRLECIHAFRYLELELAVLELVDPTNITERDFLLFADRSLIRCDLLVAQPVCRRKNKARLP